LNKDIALVCISDLHVGSVVGLWPPSGVTLDEGGQVVLNRVQQQLWRWWKDEFWSEFVPARCKKRQRVLVVNGDLVEGTAHNAAALCAPDAADQRKAAIHLLGQERRKGDLLYVVRGTEAHAGLSGGDEEAIAQALGCPQDKATGQYSRWHLVFKCNGVIVDFAHHIGMSTSPVSEGTALTTQLVLAMREAGQWGGVLPDLLVRSHRHRFWMSGAPGQRGVHTILTTPAWQGKTPFVQRISPATMPQIGGVVVLIDEDGSWATSAFLRALPLPEPEEIEVERQKQPKK
jgi:hypothetical protein